MPIARQAPAHANAADSCSAATSRAVVLGDMLSSIDGDNADDDDVGIVGSVNAMCATVNALMYIGRVKCVVGTTTYLRCSAARQTRDRAPSACKAVRASVRSDATARLAVLFVFGRSVV